MEPLHVGFALCGSFCTFHRVIPEMERLTTLGYEVHPIMSGAAYATDTRFGLAADFRKRIETAAGREIIATIPDAEPIGPKKLLDAMVIAPCTGNTLAKLACGIADTAVTMACKAHLRNGRPLVIAVSSNDALSANAKNIGELMCRRGVFLVPMRQDDPTGKPASVISDLTQLKATVLEALEGRQIQPMLLGAK